MDGVELTTALRRHRIMAIIRGSSEEASLATGRVLLEEGIRLVEVTLTTPGALTTVRTLREAAGTDGHVGAGTVLTEQDVAAVEEAGGQFVVTPGVTPSVAEAARVGLPCVAGAFTATEAYAAHVAGAAVVKLFPASGGGPGHLKALRDPFPQIDFIAVGGVGLEDADAYLRAGAIGAGIGGPLVGDAASGGSLDALRSRARAFAAWSAEAGERP